VNESITGAMNKTELLPHVIARFSHRGDAVERLCATDNVFFELCQDLEESSTVLERYSAGTQVSLPRIRTYTELVEELAVDVTEYLDEHADASRRGRK